MTSKGPLQPKAFYDSIRINLDFFLQCEFLPDIKSIHPVVLFCQKTVIVVFCGKLKVSP